MRESPTVEASSVSILRSQPLTTRFQIYGLKLHEKFEAAYTERTLLEESKECDTGVGFRLINNGSDD